VSSGLRSLVVRPVERDELDEFKALLRAHHWLGYCMSGLPMRYVAVLDGVWVALATFGSAVLRCPVREAHIGWSPRQRAGSLDYVVANQRFCVLPAGRVPNLASAVLGRILRRIDADYRRVHGLAVLAVETFTDPSRHAGTCYAAAGFTPVGATGGYGRRRGAEHYTFHGHPKIYWLRPLHRHALAVLAGGFPSPLLCFPPRRDLIELNVVEFGSLRRHLSGVSDGRKARGVRHDHVTILLVAVCALLSNNLNYTAIGEYAARLPQAALARLGARYHQTKKRLIPPSESAIRRTIQRLDADELDAAVAAWVREQLGIGTLRDSDLPRFDKAGTPSGSAGAGPARSGTAVALDGKTSRGASNTRGGHKVHLFAALVHGTRAVIAQRGVDAKTNEIPQVKPLLDDLDLNGKIITADALHTQTATATYIVEDKHADYILQVKGNQPTLQDKLIDLPQEAFGPWTTVTEKNKGRNEERRICLAPTPDGFTFPHCNQVFLLERYTRDEQGNILTAETVTGVTSLTPAKAGPAELLDHCRNHWGIEVLHNIRDVTFKEDSSKIRTGAAPQVLATIRNIGIFVLELAGHKNKAAGLRDLASHTFNLRALDLLGL
jgi:predicted transposase YbfD/YdcC